LSFLLRFIINICLKNYDELKFNNIHFEFQIFTRHGGQAFLLMYFRSKMKFNIWVIGYFRV
jgi:hypothetical protein